jgi:hypothetical protein
MFILELPAEKKQTGSGIPEVIDAQQSRIGQAITHLVKTTWRRNAVKISSCVRWNNQKD